MKIEDVRRLKTPFDVLAYLVKERESIRRKRALKLPPPWTDDEILGKYRFCNVRRADDRVSQWLINRWYKPHRDWPYLLPIVAFSRFINLPSSLEVVEEHLFASGGPEWGPIKRLLHTVKDSGRNVFNNAYMVRGSKKTPSKIDTVVDEYVSALVEKSITVNSTSMEKTHAQIMEVPGFGSFMAGQIVADLRWAMSGSWRDRNTWAPLGPGSQRGMNRLNERDLEGKISQRQFEEELRGMIERLEQLLPRDLTKRLEAMDYQNILCETDKYLRTLSGEGSPKQLYRSNV